MLLFTKIYAGHYVLYGPLVERLLDNATVLQEDSQKATAKKTSSAVQFAETESHFSFWFFQTTTCS